ncbi:DNA/RNA non-specific endonuclease [Proteus vulgaris]|uniref:DNA/RNA non-specific endonuclease n=2 Tax=Proteus TaxID=583 RepID=UPI003525F989
MISTSYANTDITVEPNTNIGSSLLTSARDISMRSMNDENCGIGCPLGGSETTIQRDVYTLNNNSETKFADWVAYLVTKDSIGSGKARNWKKDPALGNDETLSPADYKNANATLKVDRGHQAPLASLAALPGWNALNYLSNITPQKADLNQGAWVRLEDQERNLAKAGHKVFTVTGPIYERDMGKLPSTDKDHTIPSAYFKVVFLNDSPENSSYAAFIMDQQTPKKADFCEFQVTAAEVEARTGLTLWSELPENAQDVKTQAGELVKKMGCTVLK